MIHRRRLLYVDNYSLSRSSYQLRDDLHYRPFLPGAKLAEDTYPLLTYTHTKVCAWVGHFRLSQSVISLNHSHVRLRFVHTGSILSLPPHRPNTCISSSGRACHIAYTQIMYPGFNLCLRHTFYRGGYYYIFTGPLLSLYSPVVPRRISREYYILIRIKVWPSLPIQCRIARYLRRQDLTHMYDIAPTFIKCFISYLSR